MFLSFCILDDFFRFWKKSGFWVFLVHPETTLPKGLETSGQRGGRAKFFWVFAFWIIFSVFQKYLVLGYFWFTLLWHQCYYPHRLRDALSPVCGIFFSPIMTRLGIFFGFLVKTKMKAYTKLTAVMCCQIVAVAPSSGDFRPQPAKRYVCGQDQEFWRKKF